MSNDLFQFLNISPLTALHWMLAVAISLFILDIFLQSDFVSWLALILFSAYFSLYLDVSMSFPLQWLLLLFIVTLGLLFVFYYTVWAKLVSPIVKKLLLRNATAELHDRAAGQLATFRQIEGNDFVDWNGELWAANVNLSSARPQDGDQIRIIRSESGKMIVESIS